MSKAPPRSPRSTDAVLDGWSHFEGLFLDAKPTSGPLAALKYPKNDVDVISVTKDIRKSDLKGLPNSDPKDYTRGIKKYLESDWTVINLAKARPDAGEVFSAVPRTVDAEQRYECDEKAAATTTVKDATLRRPVADEAATNDRIDLLSTLYMAPPKSISLRVNPEPYRETRYPEYAIHVKELQFEYGSLEPFFCSVALYDVAEARKLSEDFNVTVSSMDALELLGSTTLRAIEPATKAKKAIFTLHPCQKKEDVYIVFLINKVLRGDLDKQFEAYGKGVLKQKEQQKAKEEIQEAVKRLSKFRQNFAIAAIPLVDAIKAGEVSCDSLIRFKGDIWGALEDIHDGKKPKTLPGHLKFSATNTPSAQFFVNRLTSSLNPRDYFNEKDPERTRECDEFVSVEEDPVPAVTHVNHLYFYPKKADLSNLAGSKSARNIVLEVKILDNDDNAAQPGLKCVYGDATTPALLTSGFTAVNYHASKPRYVDEVKMNLPLHISEKHHMLITFLHVSCKDKKGKGDEATVRSPKCLLKSVVSGKQTIVLYGALRHGYLTKDAARDVLDKKAQFSFDTRLVSTIYSTDSAVSQFLRSGSLDVRANSTEVCTALKNLVAETTKGSELVRFLPAVFKQIFMFVACSNAPVRADAFDTLVDVLVRVSEVASADHFLFEAYVKFVFDHETNQMPRYFFDALVEAWVAVIRLGAPRKYHCIVFSQFFLGLVVKSMTLHIARQKNLDDATRPSRFPPETNETLNALIVLLAQLIKENHKNPNYGIECERLNANIGEFFNDLLCIMDRGCVFEMIHNYLYELGTPAPVSVEVFGFKCVILKLLVQHPYFAALCLPTHTPKFVNVRDIAKRYVQRHFPTGLLLAQVENSLNSTSTGLRPLAFDLLCETLWIIEQDPKLERNQKDAVIKTFFPFIVMLVDKHELLPNLTASERLKCFGCWLHILKALPEELIREYWEQETEKRIFVFFQLVRKAVDEFEYKGSGYAAQLRAVAPKRNSALYPGYTDDSLGSSTGASDAGFDIQPSKPSGMAVNIKELNKKVNGTMGNLLSPGGAASKKERRKSSRPRKESGSNDTASVDTSTGPVRVPSVGASPRPALPFLVSGNALSKEMKKEAAMCLEAHLTAFDTTLRFIKYFKSSLKRREIFEKIWSTFPHLLSKNQSVAFLSTTLAKLYDMIPQFSVHLFSKGNTIVGELTVAILKRLNSPINTIRDDASSFYEFMFENNLAQTKNVDRMRLQSIIAIIRIVGESSDSSEAAFARLLNSLKVVKRKVSATAPQVAAVIKELDEKIRSIISDNMKMKQYSYDPDMTADLIYDISTRLLESPDERISWLENLAEFYRSKNNIEECAQTKIICAALAQTYLQSLGRWDIDMVPSWQLVCPSIDAELKLPDMSRLVKFKDEICQSKIFSPDGFSQMVQDAIDLLKRGGLFESAVGAYRMLLPIYFDSENYKKQKDIFADCLTLTQQLTDENVLKQRIFSNYYRVAFVGSRFGPDLDGKEFIYKEANTVRVTDVTEHMKKTYSDAFGAENFILLPNNKEIVRSELDSKKCYMQLCAVEIFMPKDEADQKKSLFKQHFGASSFVMEQPFTKSGKAHGEIDEQFIRRTIFTTERAFPFLKKRLFVVSKREEELSPVENAMAIIEKKTTMLKSEMNASTPNLKTLQRELQGTLLVQVNAGPAAVIKTFLAEENAAKWPKEQREQLADLCIEFERTLGFALRVNKGFMEATADQITLYEEMEKGYQRFKDTMSGLPVVEKRRNAKAQLATAQIQEEVVRGQKKLTESSARKKISPSLSALEDGPANAPLGRDTSISTPTEKKKKPKDLSKYTPDSSVALPATDTKKSKSPVGNGSGNPNLAKRMSRRLSEETIATIALPSSNLAKSPSSPGVNSPTLVEPLNPDLKTINEAEEPKSPPIRRGLPKTAKSSAASTGAGKSATSGATSASGSKSPRGPPSTPTVSVSVDKTTTKSSVATNPKSPRGVAQPLPRINVAKPAAVPEPASDGSVTARLASVTSPRSTADALKNAVVSAQLLLAEIMEDLSQIEPRVSIAFEVTEVAPLVRTVKQVKIELGNCSTLVSVPPASTPTGVDPADRLNYIKAVLLGEVKSIASVIAEMKQVVPYVDNIEQMITVIRALKTIKVALNA